MGERVATSIVLEAAASEVSHARRFVRRSVSAVAPGVLDDLQLITSELFTNAVEHGSGDAIEITLAHGDDEVSVTVESRGPTPDVGPANEWKVADPDALNGRGLGIVRRIADELIVERDGDEFVVTAKVCARLSCGA